MNAYDLESAWRDAWDAAPDGANTFKAALDAERVRLRGLSSGGSLQSYSQNASSHSYAPGGVSSRTPVDAERIALGAVKLYEKILADLGIAAPADDAAETSIYNEGLARLQVDSSETYHDFSLARVPIA